MKLWLKFIAWTLIYFCGSMVAYSMIGEWYTRKVDTMLDGDWNEFVEGLKK